jgi:hypothetical protein
MATEKEVSNFGGFDFGIKMIARIGSTWDNGGLPVAIS